MTYMMPSLMILLSAGSSVAYLIECDWRKAVYWEAAATITASVTF